MIKAILIDVDNTLLDFGKCSLESMKTAYREFGLPFTDEVFPVFNRVNDGLWRRIEAGTLTKAELHRIRWQLIFDELGTRADGVAFEARFYELIQSSHETVPGAEALLRRLHGKYIVAAASNASHDQQVRRLTAAGLIHYIDYVFTSEDASVPKPSAAFFDYCLGCLGITDPAEAAMIGDSLSADISGSVAYGLRTVWFNFAGEPVPEGLQVDLIADSLADIEKALPF